jgi:hypothetical protein
MHMLLSPFGRALHARIALRRQHGREPTAAEVEGWLTTYTGRLQGVAYAEITAAYNSGAEVRLVP